MSLIHQVLQDLDGRPELHVGEVIGYAEEQKNQGLVIWPAIVVLFICAALVIYFKEFIGGIGSTIATSAVPMNPVVESSFNLPNSSLTIERGPEPVVSELPEILRVKPADPVLELNEETEDFHSELVSSESISPEVLFQSSGEAITLSKELAKAEAPMVIVERNSTVFSQPLASQQSESMNSPVITSKKSNTKTATASVTRRTSAEDYYVKAVAYYRNGDWQSSLIELENASKLGGAIDYQAMKARIFLEQGMRDPFFSVYQSNADNRNVSWLSVIAPGLHMFGLYSDAIEQYSRLVSIQPGNVDWSIAKTQALIDAGMIPQAVNELRYIKDNYSLNEQQLNWLRYQQKILE